MLYLYTRIFVERQKQEFFEKFKIIAGTDGLQASATNKMIEYSKNRKREALKYWFSKVE